MSYVEDCKIIFRIMNNGNDILKNIARAVLKTARGFF